MQGNKSNRVMTKNTVDKSDLIISSYESKGKKKLSEQNNDSVPSSAPPLVQSAPAASILQHSPKKTELHYIMKWPKKRP